MKILWFTPTDYFHTAQLEWLINNDYQVKLFKIRKNWPVRPRIYASLIRKLCQRFDLIFCDFLDENAVILQRLLRKIRRKKRIIGRVHRYEVFTPFPAQIDPSVFHQVVAVSQWTKKHFLAQNPYFSEDSVSVIYNGIDERLFSFDPEKKTGEKHFVTVSGIQPVKGFYDLVQNWPENVSLSIVGSKISNDYFQYIKELIELRNLEERIRFEGLIPNHELPEFFEDKKFYINHSVNESFSVATMEAIASGLIPLIRDWPAAWEIYPHEYIYRNVPEMLEKIEVLMNHEEKEISKRRQKLRDLVEKRFTVDIQMQEIKKILDAE